MEAYRLPLGTQSFETLRSDGERYVDKTHYVERLLLFGRFIFLSRPRRFGKSLFLSTLKAYFEGKKGLFKGLYIENAEEEMARRQGRAAWEEHPVFHINLNDSNYQEPQSLEILLNDLLVQWEEIYESRPSEKDLYARFRGLVRRAYEKTNRRVVVLVDEYDKPLFDTMHTPELHERFREILHGFYSVIKGSDAYIRFAFLTGITKFSKVSIFSGLNNLKDISSHRDYAAICGFTEVELREQLMPEIEILAKANGFSLEEAMAALKKHYDGYCFSPKGEHVYNPFSVLNALADHELGNYWFESATPTFLMKYLLRARCFAPDLENKEIDSAALRDFRANEDDPLPLLFQSGYLTIKKRLPDETSYLLGYPNEEVRNAFLKNLLSAYIALSFSEANISVKELYRDLNAGNLASVMKQIEELLAGIPYGNLPRNKKGQNLREQYYQTVFYLIFRLFVQYTHVEVVCATGRVDMVVEMPQHIYLFEFKVTSAGTPDDAIAQIKAQGYATLFAADPRTVHLVGVSFNERKRNIEAWREEVLTPNGR